ncbi:uncharacterized protein METZ01_LOCUS206306 [marine metagenome]|uniref:Uncharacterized protein n=1 Tax=marine metagenome TaxID=408172 RepID=A0A382ESZ7_9ZZZZ
MGADLIIDTTAEVAQVVEHGTENAGVDSSSLSLGTIKTWTRSRGRNSIERKWLSGRAPPCQGGGREFKSRLPLQFLRLLQLDRPLLC